MKATIRLITALICSVWGGAALHAALYWDGNGTAAGAGTAPNGTWGASAFWNPTADGTTTPPGNWVSGEDAVFSAGADASGPFTVTIQGTQTAGNLTVEEGEVTLTGGTALNVGGGAAGKGLIDIAAGLTTTISTTLTGGDDAGQITKTGGGTLILNAPCAHPGATMIAGGTLKLGAANRLNPNADLALTVGAVFDMNHFDQDVGGLLGGGTILNGATLRVGHNHHPNASFSGTIGDYFDFTPTTLIKVGTGTQTLSGPSYYTGLTVVAAGVLAIAEGDALGTYDSPTVVSNGAALHLTRNVPYGEPVILHGEGLADASGALRNLAGTGWNGGVILGANARINNDAGGTWNWLAGVGGNVGVDGTSAGGVFSVTFGGNGGTTQLKNSYRTIILNNAPIYKDGTSTLRFETPTLGVSACHLNGGFILTRAAYANFLPAGAPIYVGPAAGGFDTGFNFPGQNVIHSPIVLAAGANPLFLIRTNQGGGEQMWKQGGVISGLGGLTKTNSGPGLGGTLFLMATNTYSGETRICGGTLTLGANGSLSNSAVIDLPREDAVFNVSSNAGGFVLQPAQTLQGIGTVLGNVIADGTLSPGASIGRLTNDGNLTLSGHVLIDVDKSLSPAASNDCITVTGALSHSGGGAVLVANLGPALAVGDRFQIFNQPVSGGQTMTVTGAGVTWTNQLAVDGSIAVASLVTPTLPAPRLTALVVAGAPSVRVTWTNVVTGSNYWLQYNTNLNTPHWFDLNPVTAWGATASQLDGIPTGVRERYYRVRCQFAGEPPPGGIPRITAVTFLPETTVTVHYTNTLAGSHYVLQYSTNLNTTNWTSLNPVTADGPVSAATDSLPIGTPQRYYRVYGQF